jgi:hypothetical protein
MTILQFPPFPHHEDRVYAPIDDAFDLTAICTEEGLVISARDDGTVEFLGKCAIDESFLSTYRE